MAEESGALSSPLPTFSPLPGMIFNMISSCSLVPGPASLWEAWYSHGFFSPFLSLTEKSLSRIWHPGLRLQTQCEEAWAIVPRVVKELSYPLGLFILSSSPTGG